MEGPYRLILNCDLVSGGPRGSKTDRKLMKNIVKLIKYHIIKSSNTWFLSDWVPGFSSEVPVSLHSSHYDRHDNCHDVLTRIFVNETNIRWIHVHIHIRLGLWYVVRRSVKSTPNIH